MIYACMANFNFTANKKNKKHTAGMSKPLQHLLTFSSRPHLVSTGHRRARPGRSGINTAPLRLLEDSRELESEAQLQNMPTESRLTDYDVHVLNVLIALIY